MPCQSYGDSVVYVPNPVDKDLKAEADRVTQLLCCLCGELTEQGLFKKVKTPALEKWWEEHKEMDNHRVSRQMKARFRKDSSLSPRKLADQMIQEAEAVHPVSSYHRKWFHGLAELMKKEVTGANP